MLRIINRDPQEYGTADTHDGLMDAAQKFAEEISNQNWYQGVEGIWTTDELKSKYKLFGNEASNMYPTIVYGYHTGVTTGRITGTPQDMWNEWTRMRKYYRLNKYGDTSVNYPRYAPLCFSDLTLGIGVTKKNNIYYWVVLSKLW